MNEPIHQPERPASRRASALVALILAGLIGFTIGVQYGRSSDPAKPAAINDGLGKWTKAKSIDKFGDPTGRFLFTTEIGGYFSNSATAKSKLSGYISLQKDKLGHPNLYFVLREYASSPISIYGEQLLLLAVKLPDGQIKQYELDYHRDTFWFRNLRFLSFLRDTDGLSEVKCALEYQGSEYLFTIPIAGLREAALEVSQHPDLFD